MQKYKSALSHRARASPSADFGATLLDSSVMAKPRHLARAPITEAVLDIMVAARPGATFADLQKSYETLDFGYHLQGAVIAGTVGFMISPEAQLQHGGATEKIGLRIHSKDEKYVALVRTNGLSLSRLTPYEDWDALEAEAHRLWDVYVARWAPARVLRLGARFINNLRLPMKPAQSFSDFINTLTELPPQVPQGMGPFLQQFQCVEPSSPDYLARLVLAWNGQTDDGRIPIILDVGATKAHQCDPTDPAMWSNFVALRELKNRCFFGTVTELALKEYE